VGFEQCCRLLKPWYSTAAEALYLDIPKACYCLCAGDDDDDEYYDDDEWETDSDDEGMPGVWDAECVDRVTIYTSDTRIEGEGARGRRGGGRNERACQVSH
jgi:hypothetical protein